MEPFQPDRLPVDPRTGEPIPPKPQPGYYPDYHVLDQQAFWDEATRKTVLERLEKVPPIRFFTEAEARLLEAVFDRLIPQDDRDEAHQIPILPWVDERLHLGMGDGYRYEDMPPDPQAYRLGVNALERLAQELHRKSFLELNVTEQDELLKSLHDGKPAGAHELWGRLPAHRFFLLMLHDAAHTYYAHPWAWDEIGYGGPAYPRGYMRLERGEPEPWESDEQRYPWEAPPSSRSGGFEELASAAEQGAMGGKGGTH